MRIREGSVAGGPRLLADAIPRDRLIEMLEHGAPLTVVRAVSGAGKTVAVRAWTEATMTPVAWVTVHPSSAAPATFVVEVLRRFAQLGLRVEPVAAEDPWAALRSALHDVEGEVVLVVDNSDAADETTLVELCRLLGSVESLRVIAIENRSTVLDRPGVALLVRRSEIGPADLMLDEQEVAQALSVTPLAAATVHAATNGLPALVDQLAKRGYRGHDETGFDGALDEVEGYMRLRMSRAHYDPRMIDTVVRVSVADIMDAELAVLLSGNTDAPLVLDKTESFGFGAWSVRGTERLFQLTPFARALLRRELRRRHAGDVARLRRTVVEWLLARALPLDALRLAIEDDDLDLATRVVKGSWYELHSEHSSAVIEHVGGVRLSRLREWPLLVLLLSICMNVAGHNSHHALLLSRAAVAAAGSVGEGLPDADRVFVWAAESVALRVTGMREQAAKAAARALAALGAMPDDIKEARAGELPVICAQLGVSLHYGGHPHQAMECFAVGAALAEIANRRNGLSCLAMLSGIHAINGDMPEARRYIDLIRGGSWAKAALEGQQGAFYHVAEALLALEVSDSERAQQHVAVLAQLGPTSEHWLTIAYAQAHVAIRSGRAELGRVQLESLVASRGREGRSGAARRALATTRALLHLALGDTVQARAVLDHDGASAFPARVARARLALAEDLPAAALHELSAERPLARVSPRLRANALAVKTAALLRLGGEEAAVRDVAELGAVLGDRGLRDPLALLPPDDLRLTLDALNESVPGKWESILSALPAARARPRLSSGEVRVVLAMMRGASIAEVAEGLGVSSNTVKTQLKSIYRKLGVSGRGEAIAMAVSRGILPVRSDVAAEEN